MRPPLRYAEKSAGVKIKQASLSVGGVGIACEYATGTSVITRADSIISKLDIDKAITEAENGLDLKNKTIRNLIDAEKKQVELLTYENEIS